MSDHLPECPVAKRRGTVNPSDCICDRLRACEKRALDSAREADSALDEGPKYLPYWIDREEALIAIDALWRDVIFGTMIAVPIIALLTWLAWQL